MMGLDHFHISCREPALAAVGKFYVGESANVVKNLYAGALVEDEKILGTF